MITIISSDFCPYCQMAKQLIADLGFEYTEEIVEIGSERLQEIIQITGMMTVPQIFTGTISKDSLLGGYSDIQKLHNEGKLIDILNKS